MTVQIILPECSEDAISEGLRGLTALLEQKGHELSGGFLGGHWGYGARFENDVFMMHPYCWCEKDDCLWCFGCECIPEPEHYVDGVRVEDWYEATAYMVPEYPHDVAEHGTPEYKAASRKFDKAIKARDKRVKIIFPEIIHTCGNPWTIDQPRRNKFGPPPHAPNFWHKPSGFRVWWYKYIGRGMELYGDLPADMFIQCAESLTKG